MACVAAPIRHQITCRTVCRRTLDVDTLPRVGRGRVGGPHPPPREAFAAEMQAAGVDWRIVVFGGALHAFHHPMTLADQTLLPGVGHHPRHARRAWPVVLDLLAECLLASG